MKTSEAAMILISSVLILSVKALQAIRSCLVTLNLRTTARMHQIVLRWNLLYHLMLNHIAFRSWTGILGGKQFLVILPIIPVQEKQSAFLIWQVHPAFKNATVHGMSPNAQGISISPTK